MTFSFVIFLLILTLNYLAILTTSFNTSNALWHIPAVTEGISSHYIEMEKLWRLGQEFGRDLVEARYSFTHHYPEFSWISICDIFIFPSSLKCTNMTYQEICAEKQCVIIESGDWYMIVL